MVQITRWRVQRGEVIMAQYIPKDALVAEIEKVISGLRRNCNPNPLGNMQECLAAAEIEALNLIKDSINTLEVKEVSNIWHTISDNDVDLPKVGDIICFITNGKVISGEYRLNKYYGKVCNGYDNPIEKGDKWCFLSDILNSVAEEKGDMEWFKRQLDEVIEMCNELKEAL